MGKRVFLSLCVCPVMGVFPTRSTSMCDSHFKYRQKEEKNKEDDV